ncbi:MAG: hypothetical protein XXXJIFNMEKO3_00607 [Candidatus Erwinia impunctatus]|nr:hypothetical protein XXXJIFNMEKO_00607 [Culicoides impunctatus]
MMKKKTRTEAGIIGQVSANDDTPTIAIKPAPKKHRAFVYVLFGGDPGVSENDILRRCHLSSGRNYPNEIERETGIRFERIKEKNPDGIGSHYRYRFSSRDDVVRVIKMVNNKAAAGGYKGLSQSEINDILALYPEIKTA